MLRRHHEEAVLLPIGNRDPRSIQCNVCGRGDINTVLVVADHEVSMAPAPLGLDQVFHVFDVR